MSHQGQAAIQYDDNITEDAEIVGYGDFFVPPGAQIKEIKELEVPKGTISLAMALVLTAVAADLILGN